MPLYPGKKNIGRNIKELQTNGTRPRSHSQILAIALNEANQQRKPGNKIKKAIMSSMPARAMNNGFGSKSNIAGAGPRPNPTNPMRGRTGGRRFPHSRLGAID